MIDCPDRRYLRGSAYCSATEAECGRPAPVADDRCVACLGGRRTEAVEDLLLHYRATLESHGVGYFDGEEIPPLPHPDRCLHVIASVPLAGCGCIHNQKHRCELVQGLVDARKCATRHNGGPCRDFEEA